MKIYHKKVDGPVFLVTNGPKMACVTEGRIMLQFKYGGTPSHIAAQAKRHITRLLK
jgi:hypothetical protein